jgi:hypothetical protein
MAGDIWVGGGGSMAVATSGLFDDAQRLERVRGILAECLAALATIDRLVVGSAVCSVETPPSARAAERAMDDAASALARAAPSADRLRLALMASAQAYGFGEAAAERLARDAAGRVGALFGMVLPVIALDLLPWALGIGGGIALGIAVLPPDLRAAAFAALPRWLRENSAVLSDPRVVGLVRLSVMSADDVGGGLLRLPPELVRLLGDEGLGILGLATSSGVVVGLARPTGALVETPVSVARFGHPVSATPARGFGDRAARVPQGAAQVRIDRYSQAGRPDRFEVYIGGTRDPALAPGADPWDMTSNVNAIAGGDAGSYRAVAQAMADAGVTPASPVIFTGYSQGGLIAADLVASGDYDARGLYTLGAPAAQVAVPASVPWVAIEHIDDIVPAVGGTWATADPVLVRRELFDGRPVATNVMLPAHQLDGYRETAALVDRSPERRVIGALTSFDRVGDGATAVESTLYHATRRPADDD